MDTKLVLHARDEKEALALYAHTKDTYSVRGIVCMVYIDIIPVIDLFVDENHKHVRIGWITLPGCKLAGMENPY